MNDDDDGAAADDDDDDGAAAADDDDDDGAAADDDDDDGAAADDDDDGADEVVGMYPIFAQSVLRNRKLTTTICHYGNCEDNDNDVIITVY